jgi:DNA-binding transcriptional MerR regulator
VYEYKHDFALRVKLIRGALCVGFSVKEFEGIFHERDRGGAPCKRVRNLASEKLAALETQLRDLTHLRQELRSAIAEWDRVLKKTPRGKRAGLLERFVATRPIRPPRISKRFASKHTQEN